MRKRIIFYVPGYDPIPPRRYRELYRSEGKRQANVSGYDLEVAGLTGTHGYSWKVKYLLGDQTVTSRCDFLKWSDIVQDSMQISILSTYFQMFITLGYYVRTGVLLRLFRLRPAPMIAALYPVAMLSMQLGIAALAGRFARHLLLLIPGVPFAAALTLGLSLSVAIVMLCRRMDGHFYAYYLALDYIFSARNGGRLPRELAERLAEFADTVRQSMHKDYDEILIVGHSTGAHLAVDLARNVLASAPASARISLLTLGQVIPMVSFLPQANELRAALHELAKDRRLTWIDVSAPGDGACFALSDPVAVSGVDPAPSEKLWPRVVSAAFSDTLSPETLRRTRWRFFRRHIQYLCAFDHPQSYDYFAITAGPLTLAQRFEFQNASSQKDTRKLSPFTAM